MRIYRFEESFSSHPAKFDFPQTENVHFIKGRYATLYLDLMRAVMGVHEADAAMNSDDDAPYRVDATVEMKGHTYEVTALIHNSEPDLFAVNFTSDGKTFSAEDTEAYLEGIFRLDKGDANIFKGERYRNNACLGESDHLLKSFREFLCTAGQDTEQGDDRPLFVYPFFERLDECIDREALIEELRGLNRQVFIAVE